MADVKYKLSTRAGNPITVLSTELNAMANGGGALSATIDNAADLDLYMDLELTVTFAAPPTANTLVEAYIVRSVDGTTFEDATAGAAPVVPGNGYAGGFVLRAVTTAQRLVIPMVQVPPRDFLVQLVNRSGQAFPAVGSVCRALFYKEQVV